MIPIRHRTASGRLDSMWEFDSERRVVDLVIQLANAKPFAFAVKVCSTETPRLWSHPIMRLDLFAWRILPAVWTVDTTTSKVGEPPVLVPKSCGGRTARPFPCDLHAIIGDASHIVLTNAPLNVDQELAELDI